MFTIPSFWNIFISTVVFIITVWYLHRVLDDNGMPKGMTRSLLVFVLAYIISWASGEFVNWSRERMYGPEPVSQSPKNLKEALDNLKENDLTPPLN